MDISEHIYTCSALLANAEKLKELKAFFEDFPLKEAQDWPMCATKQNGEPRYVRVQVQTDQFGFEKTLYLAFECESGNAKYLIAQRLKYDDALQIELDCIRRIDKKEKTTSRFVFHLMEQYSRFLKQFALTSTAQKKTHTLGLKPIPVWQTVFKQTVVMCGRHIVLILKTKMSLCAHVQLSKNMPRETALKLLKRTFSCFNIRAILRLFAQTKKLTGKISARPFCFNMRGMAK